MFPPTLKSDRDFARVFSERRRVFRNGLTFFFRPSEFPIFRFGIVAPKRFGKAVQRNTFRRRIREIFRLYKSLPMGLDVIVCVNRPIQEFSFAMLSETIQWSIPRIFRTIGRPDPLKSPIHGN